MTERAGPTNQAGIFYQNSIAARYLADLLSLQQLPPRETVVEVRVEAPTHVDDIVVLYQDGHRDWIQAKSNLQKSGEPWADLWRAFAKQFSDSQFGANDKLVIALGRRGNLADNLQALIERAQSAESQREWLSRLGDELLKTLGAVEICLPGFADLFDLFRRVDLRVATVADVDAIFRRLDLATAIAVPRQLQSFLRDIVGNESRVRAIFRASMLRKRLADEFGADLFEPREWGLPAYRDTVQRMSRIEIPGRGISVPVQDLFVWPTAIRMNSSSERDFEDETPRWDVDQKFDNVDLSQFPADGLDRCVLVAGPGFGKSTLVAAVAAKLTSTPIVPVAVSLGTFALTDENVVEYLESRVNRDYAVRVDWRRLAEQGLACILFDGLDEVPTGQRANLIKRIAMFSARFPNVSWLLTIRDPAVLNGPLDAELIELQPLNNSEIYNLVEKFKTWIPGLDEWTFTNDLQAYPDIARFARIPLFLSIMLGRWSPDAPLPRKRSDLIEIYLTSLFDSDISRGQNGIATAGSELRAIAQAIAFTCLEREEIGLSERQALQVVANHHDGPGDVVLGQLLANGVLRRSIDGRLQFPYPIVQEYLAAIYLVDFAPEQVARRIGDVVKRPWAQVLQFALELFDDPSTYVREILDTRDDIFSTNLRLVGRCVANGAAVNSQLRDEIGTKLAELWGRSGYNIREKVGRLLVDSFSKPLHAAVQTRLGCRWLLQSGAGEIVVKANDPILTRAVVSELLEGELDTFMSLNSIRTALEAIGPDVVKMVTERARRRGTTKDELEGLAEFLEVVRLDEANSHLLLPLAEDKDMPLVIRFAAYVAMANPPTQSTLEMAKTALGDAHWLNQSAGLKILARSEHVAKTLGDILIDKSAPLNAKDYLIHSIGGVVRDKFKRADVVHELIGMQGLVSRHRDILKVYALRCGDRECFLELLDALDRVDSDVAQAVLATLNHFPERGLGDRAYEKIRNRTISPTEVPNFVTSTMTGLTCAISDFGWNSYAIDPALTHPSFQTWMPVFDDWLAVEGITKVQRLRIIMPMLNTRPELISEVQSIVFGAMDLDAEEWTEDDYGLCLRSSMDELRRHRIKVPFELAESFALSKRPNLPYAGVAAIAAVASREALDRLISLHRRISQSNRTTVLDAIEVLASRLNIQVMPEHLEDRSSV